jgi:hypothetical protein
MNKDFSVKDLLHENDNNFIQSIEPGPGFTFISKNISNSDFLSGLETVSVENSDLTDKSEWRVIFKHDKFGLEFQMLYEYYLNSNTLEISGKVTNQGSKIIEGVKGPFSLSLGFDLTKIGTPSMTSIYGGRDVSSSYPPPAYKITESDGARSLMGGVHGGRSSETEAPYVFFTDKDETCGFFYAFEWPGQWIFCNHESVKNGRNMLSIFAHVACTEFDFNPGESLVIPKINLGFFKGDTFNGSNILRKHVVENIRRNVSEGTMLPPVFYNHWFGLGNDFNVEVLKKEADIYSELGVEYFTVDAGWHKNGFRNGIGNWETAAPEKFPNGMEEIADYVRSRGMKFGTWLELEFAMKNSDWGKTHPEWFYNSKGRRDLFYFKKTYEELLLKLDDEKVRMSVLEFLERTVERYGLEWIRWDINNSPAPFWEANESENQWGKIQLGYCDGLYSLLDDFMRKCPQVHIEACAGGGQRMDLGTLRRAHSLWMSDQAHAYHTVRRFQSGLNRILPGCYPNSVFLWVSHEHERKQSLESLRKEGYPPVVLRSKMAGSLGFSEQSQFFTPEITKYLKQEIKNYKAQRHLLMKDYYPLFFPQSIRDFDGWQFYDPQNGDGFFMIFRCESPDSEVSINLRGLEKGKVYETTDVDSFAKETFHAESELKIKIPKSNGVAWYRYSVKK